MTSTNTTSATLNAVLLEQQFMQIDDTIGDALEWVEMTREQAPRLDLEADRLNLQLQRCRDKARRLTQAAKLTQTLGFYGHSQAGKSYLICALAAGNYGRLETRLGGVTLDYLTQINPGNRAARLATRFTRQTELKDRAFPVRVLLLNEADLAQALKSGRVAGAALDVLSSEPPSPDNPLLSAPNCLVTPHIAWATKEARTRLMDIATDNLAAFIKGEPKNVVNP